MPLGVYHGIDWVLPANPATSSPRGGAGLLQLYALAQIPDMPLGPSSKQMPLVGFVRGAVAVASLLHKQADTVSGRCQMLLELACILLLLPCSPMSQ